MNFMDDGVSIDTNNCNIWVHNLDLFYGATGSDADQKKGEAGGMIKAYANQVNGAASLIYANSDEGTKKANATSFDAYLASSRTETVPSSYKTVSGGTTYNNFDTKYDIGVSAADVDDASEVPGIVTKYAGRINGGDFQWKFTDADNANYSVDNTLKNNVVNYTSSVVSIGGNGGKSSASEGGTVETSEETTETKESTNKETTETKESTNKETTDSSANASELIHNFTKNGKTSNFYSITGSTSTSKGTVTYNGMKLTTCLKMESSTNVAFTTVSDKTTLTLVFSDKNKDSAVKVDGTSYKTDSNGVVTVTLKKGSHSIKKDAKTFLFYISVEE